MKKISIILMLIVLSGCKAKNSYSEVNYPEKPPELADCIFFKMANDKGDFITVARCPNSTTTTTTNIGKIRNSVSIVDGVPNERIQQQDNENLTELIPQ